MYNSGQRKGPGTLITMDQVTSCKNQAHVKNLIWLLTRQVNTEEQIIPCWTGFNIAIHENRDILQDIIGYLPTINSPTTDLGTCSLIIKQSKTIMKQLKLSEIQVVADQALYAKISEIL